MGVFIKTYALIATVPFISFFLIYYLMVFMGKEKKHAFNWAFHSTTILLFSAVSAQIKFIFQLKQGFWWVFFWVLFLITSIGFLQWKIKRKISLRKIMIATSKLSFILFSIAYILFFVIGLFCT
ncbi:DUF3397 family protein [Tepidibacillus infernus]|uniref:DUF3397 domain-containing protein n=1 Tax=Tepidibacillus decaturensis TaxID=1413211 RepID=A0A135L444_9BACI|nr:hypothetical protein U473_06990 [Tepidibacillus decaturensis]GBF11998.1 hypothetical protein HK1_02058 [Tepidibacillus sp. HK-1]